MCKGGCLPGTSAIAEGFFNCVILNLLWYSRVNVGYHFLARGGSRG